MRRLVEGMEPDDRVRLLDEMPAVVARKVVSELSPHERDLTTLLLGYPAESAGRIMSPEYLELRPEATVDEALAKIRERGQAIEALDVLPVRDPQRRLLGAVRLTDLDRASPELSVEEAMDREFRRLAPTTTRSRWPG